MKIAVITATIPERAALLEECKASVAAQTRPADAHVIGIDREHKGESKIRNELIAGLDPSFDWIAIIDDDDLMLPNHLEVLAANSENADIVYPDCITQGFPEGSPSWRVHEFKRDEMWVANYIPVTSLIRRSMFEAVGGYKSCPKEDWWFWLAAHAKGARFVFVPEKTWIYRKHER